MRRLWLDSALSLLLSVGCVPGSAPTEPPASVAELAPLVAGAGEAEPVAEESTTEPEPAVDATVTDRADDHCAQLRRSFLDRLAAAPMTCVTSQDCANRPGGIPGAGCGSVVDAGSAKILYEIYLQFRQDCEFVHCAPKVSRPVCDDGRCRAASQSEMEHAPRR